MSRTLKERVKEELERRGYTVGIGEIEEVRNARDVQTLIYELEAKEYELPGPIGKYYLVEIEEDGIIFKCPVVYGELQEDLILKYYEEDGFSCNGFDGEDYEELSDPDNPLSDDF
jgi:hypothetical protein